MTLNLTVLQKLPSIPLVIWGQASHSAGFSLRHCDSCALYHPFVSWFLLWERRWGQQQEPLEPFCPGRVLCLGPQVTVKGVLFCSCLQKNSSLPYCSSFGEGKKALPFHLRKLLSSLSLLLPLLWFFSPLWISLLHFYPEATEGELVVLLHMDFRFIEGRGECLPSQTGSMNPGFGNLGYWSTSRGGLWQVSKVFQWIQKNKNQIWHLSYPKAVTCCDWYSYLRPHPLPTASERLCVWSVVSWSLQADRQEHLKSDSTSNDS